MCASSHAPPTPFPSLPAGADLIYVLEIWAVLLAARLLCEQLRPASGFKVEIWAVLLAARLLLCEQLRPASGLKVEIWESVCASRNASRLANFLAQQGTGPYSDNTSVASRCGLPTNAAETTPRGFLALASARGIRTGEARENFYTIGPGPCVCM